MRKILSILAAVGLTSTAASAVVACGNKSNSEVGNKTNLSDVPVIKALESKLTITGNVNMTADDAWASFSAIPGVEVALTTVKLEKADFKLDLNLPTYVVDGSLKITVNKEESNYSGSLSVSIKAIGQKDLGELNLNKQLVNSFINQDSAFDSFIKLNSNIAADLKDNLQIKGFEASTRNDNGSLTLEGKSDGKYKGEVKVEILSKGNRTDIRQLITPETLSSISGTKDMTAEEAFETVLRDIPSWPNANDFLEYDEISFSAPSSNADGSLTIFAKPGDKFVGEIKVIIKLTSAAKILSTNDDHKTTIITLSTEDSLRLGYIKKDGDKFVAGDKLPNGPLTTKIGESTITATFTPNFENGTVQVLLTIDTPTNN